MIQIIAGKKGSGKTKRLIDMTNNAVKTSSGNVVFLDKNDSYMYEVDRAVRFVIGRRVQRFQRGNVPRLPRRYARQQLRRQDRLHRRVPQADQD